MKNKPNLLKAAMGILVIVITVFGISQFLSIHVVEPQKKYYEVGKNVEFEYRLEPDKIGARLDEIYFGVDWLVIPYDIYVKSEKDIESRISKFDRKIIGSITDEDKEFLYIRNNYVKPYGGKSKKDTMTHASTHTIPVFVSTSGVPANRDYMIIVIGCIGKSEWWGLTQKYYCEVNRKIVFLYGEGWCDTSVEGHDDEYCWQKYRGYCDDNLHQCIQPCQNCRSDENCIADKFSSVEDLRKVKEELERRGLHSDLGCVPKTHTCMPSTRGYDIDCANLLNIKVNKITKQSKPSVLTVDYPVTIDGAYCDTENPDEITQIINKYIKVGKFGTCRAGCREDKDCEGLSKPTINYGGIDIIPEGHVCYNGKCYLRFCSNPSDCLYTVGIFAQCNTKLGVCERLRCNNDYDCWNAEIMPSDRFAGGCVKDKETGIKYCMWKYKGKGVPTDHINPALCELASQDPYSGISKLPGPDYVYDTSSGKCEIRKIEGKSECNPQWSFEKIQEVCTRLHGKPKGEYYSCEHLTTKDETKGYCNHVFVPPRENCQLADDPLIYCWDRVALGYCEKPACLADGTCSVQKAKCTKDEDCEIGSVRGYCDRNGCCVWESEPTPTTTISIQDEIEDILPAGLNVWIILGILSAITGLGLLIRSLRR